jgi:hypothetical protein
MSVFFLIGDHELPLIYIYKYRRTLCVKQGSLTARKTIFLRVLTLEYAMDKDCPKSK